LEIMNTDNQAVKLPVLIWINIIVAMLTISIGSYTIFNYSIKGWSWVITLLLSLVIIFQNFNKISFPWYLWLPWVSYVCFYQLMSNVSTLQRTALIVCPVIVGMAVSAYRYQEEQLAKFINLCRKISILIFIIVLIKSGMALTFTLPEITGLAAEVMTAILFCSIFASLYLSNKEVRNLFYWSMLAVIPVIALTRTAIIVAASTIHLSMVEIKFSKRIIMLIITCSLVLILFSTDRVQKKMFFSGEGEMSDIFTDNFRTSGRYNIWEWMKIEIENKPYFGHGTDASGKFVKVLTGGLEHPHNDWLRLAFDYGYVGTCIFILTIILQIYHLFRSSKLATFNSKILLFASASSFVSMAMMMYTDNIILYAAFFGNMQFTIMGLAYAADRDNSINSNVPIVDNKSEC
jgi:O-antigen ligase